MFFHVLLCNLNMFLFVDLLLCLPRMEHGNFEARPSSSDVGRFMTHDDSTQRSLARSPGGLPGPSWDQDVFQSPKLMFLVLHLTWSFT